MPGSMSNGGDHHSFNGGDGNYSNRSNMERYTTTSVLTRTSTKRQKMSHMRDNYENVYGKPYGGANVMVDDNMLKGKQDKIRRAHDVDNVRFITPEGKN